MNSRVLVLKTQEHDGQSVVYIMSRDQRVKDNHALLLAQQDALKRELPLIVCFNLLPHAGVRAQEHYTFMLAGLQEVADELKKLGVSFVMTSGKPEDSYKKLFSETDPAAVYFDFSPLSGMRKAAKAAAKLHKGSTYVVDTHNIIPTWVTSDKLEFAAHTIRRKVHQHLPTYLKEPDQLQKHSYTLSSSLSGISFTEAKKIIASVPARGISIDFKPGQSAAEQHLKQFITNRLDTYAHARNDMSSDGQSNLSPYLHFGQLSSLRVALEVQYAVNKRPLLFDQPKMAQAGSEPSNEDGMNALFEEMIVRKELSDNFCLHTTSYKTLEGAAEWAQTTLREHSTDSREHEYSLKDLESAQTADPAWNAAQNQMTKTGKMHGYMRMYWAKKILEWSPDPQTAVDHAIYLNDAYSIDGGDPNGYVGIMWSIAGVHDRPWTERDVFGKIRYMNYGGLKRKFDIEAYITKWT